MGIPEASVIVKVPEKDWDVLSETLDLDSRSYGFDPSLRELIALALKDVRVVERKKAGRTWHLELLVPEGAWDVLQETLELDMYSKWVGKDLQRQIRKAFEKLDVKKISPKDWSPLWPS